MRNLISILDFSTDELYELMNTANDIIANPGKYSEMCKGKKLHDKRDSEADRQTKRDIDRIMKEKIYQ